MSRCRPDRRSAGVLILVLMMGLLMFGSAQVMASGGTEAAGEHGEAVDAEHGAAGEHHSSVTSEKLWDLLWRAMNFFVLFGILFYVLRKPAGQFFSNRRENIANTLKEFEAKKAETEARYKELEEKLNALESEKDKILADYIQEGEEEKKKIIAHAQDMAARIKQQAEITIGQEIKTAKTELTREIADLSASMAEDLIKKNINDQDQERLVEEYLDKVVPN